MNKLGRNAIAFVVNPVINPDLFITGIPEFQNRRSKEIIVVDNLKLGVVRKSDTFRLSIAAYARERTDFNDSPLLHQLKGKLSVRVCLFKHHHLLLIQAEAVLIIEFSLLRCCFGEHNRVHHFFFFPDGKRIIVPVQFSIERGERIWLTLSGREFLEALFHMVVYRNLFHGNTANGVQFFLLFLRQCTRRLL